LNKPVFVCECWKLISFGIVSLLRFHREKKTEAMCAEFLDRGNFVWEIEGGRKLRNTWGKRLNQEKGFEGSVPSKKRVFLFWLGSMGGGGGGGFTSSSSSSQKLDTVEI